MLDRWALAALARPIHALASALHGAGVRANTITALGFALGAGAAVAIACGAFVSGLALLVLSRMADGLDGAVARLAGPTDVGAYLDITLDFLFYAFIPLGFAVADPARNALPAACLLVSFVGTGSTFLAFAVMAERRGWQSPRYPNKGLAYLGGLTEGFETLACFAAMCWWPEHFPWLAYGFAALCGLTWVSRMGMAWSVLRQPGPQARDAPGTPEVRP